MVITLEPIIDGHSLQALMKKNNPKNQQVASESDFLRRTEILKFLHFGPLAPTTGPVPNIQTHLNLVTTLFYTILTLEKSYDSPTLNLCCMSYANFLKFEYCNLRFEIFCVG